MIKTGIKQIYSGTLSSAGAWTTGSNTVYSGLGNNETYDKCILLVNYSSGSVGGYPRIKVEGTYDNSLWYPLNIIDSAISTVATGAYRANVGRANFYLEAGNHEAKVVFDVEGAAHLRFFFAEVGVTASAGILSASCILGR